MNYEYLASESDLQSFCKDIAGSQRIGFDTEFVSEDRYFPHLCLIQVVADSKLAIIDPLEISDLNCFWRMLAQGDHTTIVHAGREEFRFCQRAIGARPVNWFDTQLAAGLIGLDYPGAYGTLISRLLSHKLSKGETRTDWRRRPLSDRQLDYALQDVVYLEDLYREIMARTRKLQRESWLKEELTAWQDQQENDEKVERWRRVSGISGLTRRQMTVARELWRWRDEQAQARDVPAKRVLRDDLLVELSRRGSADPKRIRAVRGMDWRKLQRSIPEIAASIAKGLAVPDASCPSPGKRSQRPPFTLLGQFLSTAVNSMARSHHVAPSLVGSVEDVRRLIAHHLGYPNAEKPRLATGWRATVVGQVVNRLLDGELAIQISEPESDRPLSLIDMATKEDVTSADNEATS